MAERQRILAFDVARCLAVVGMVIVNYKLILVAGELGATGETPQAGPAWLDVLTDLFTGRAVATFVVLAGIGVSLLSRRGRETGDPRQLAADRGRLLRRAVFLFVVGLLYAPIWPADILHFYGVYLLAAVFLLTAHRAVLWTLAAASSLIFVGMLLVLDYGAGWQWETLTYTDFWTVEGFVRHLFFNGFHPFFPWVAFLLVGMWMGRLDFRVPRVRRQLAIGGATVVTIAETISWWLETIVRSTPDLDPETIYLVGTGPMPPMPLYLLSGGGTAVAVIALVAMLTERAGDAPWLQPFVAAGQLALTLYVAHVVVGIGLLEMLGIDRDRSLTFAASYSALFCLVAIIFSWVWRRRFQHGPLEWVMRRMTG